MNTNELIHKAGADGVIITLSSISTLKAIGEQQAVNRWIPIIRSHKQLLLLLLNSIFSQESFQERAAIMEFDGELSRGEAEFLTLRRMLH